MSVDAACVAELGPHVQGPRRRSGHSEALAKERVKCMAVKAKYKEAKRCDADAITIR